MEVGQLALGRQLVPALEGKRAISRSLACYVMNALLTQAAQDRQKMFGF
jgi:hypothetical protein